MNTFFILNFVHSFSSVSVYYSNSTPQRYVGFSNRASFSLTFFKNNRIFNFCLVLPLSFQGFSHSKRILSAILCPKRWYCFSSHKIRSNSILRLRVNKCEIRGPNVNLVSEILTTDLLRFYPPGYPFRAISGWQKGDREDLFWKRARSKSTVWSSEIDNFRRANRRFAKKQTVDLQAWNRQFGQVKLAVCFSRLVGLKTTVLIISVLWKMSIFRLFTASGKIFCAEAILSDLKC